jgi:hypothetical protein
MLSNAVEFGSSFDSLSYLIKSTVAVKAGELLSLGEFI